MRDYRGLLRHTVIVVIQFNVLTKFPLFSSGVLILDHRPFIQLLLDVGHDFLAQLRMHTVQHAFSTPLSHYESGGTTLESVLGALTSPEILGPFSTMTDFGPKVLRFRRAELSQLPGTRRRCFLVVVNR